MVIKGIRLINKGERIMLWLFKIILFPVSILLSILIAFLKFLLNVGAAFLYIVMLFCIFGALASFIQGDTKTAIMGLVLGFIFSPYGLPSIGIKIVAFLEVINKKLKYM